MLMYRDSTDSLVEEVRRLRAELAHVRAEAEVAARMRGPKRAIYGIGLGVLLAAAGLAFATTAAHGFSRAELLACNSNVEAIALALKLEKQRAESEHHAAAICTSKLLRCEDEQKTSSCPAATPAPPARSVRAMPIGGGWREL
jgi:hypothetical protein